VIRMLLLGLLMIAAPTVTEAKVVKANATKAKTAAVAVANPACATGACASPVPCCPQWCISYKQHHPRRKVCCNSCLPPVSTVLMVKDPCVCGCLVPVPVCLPACCTGEPTVCAHPGIFGRTVVEYDWCCGYRLRLVFDKHGGLTVHSYGS
jgi:hypothetical protein